MSRITWNIIGMWAVGVTYLFLSEGVSAESAGVPVAAPGIPTDRERFHIYLLMGQSNMAGRGPLDLLSDREYPRIRMLTENHQWVPVREPLHQDKPTAGAGLGLTFAITMAEAYPDAVIGLVPCAVGGTPLARWEKGGDLYARAVERAREATRQGTLRGVLWHQGENDTGDRTAAETYADRCARMFADLRADLGTPDLPVVAGELGWFLEEINDGKPVFWRLVNDQIHLLPERLRRVAVVSSDGLTALGDKVHFDTPSLREFGRRYAAAMLRLQGEMAGSSGPITETPPSAGGTP